MKNGGRGPVETALSDCLLESYRARLLSAESKQLRDENCV